ncbi:MAG: hypothetical protein WDM92_07315 [Caulobacteraceae bacterium]
MAVITNVPYRMPTGWPGDQSLTPAAGGALTGKLRRIVAKRLSTGTPSNGGRHGLPARHRRRRPVPVHLGHPRSRSVRARGGVPASAANGVKGPGLFWIIPLGVDRFVKVDLRVLTDGVESRSR